MGTADVSDVWLRGLESLDLADRRFACPGFSCWHDFCLRWSLHVLVDFRFHLLHYSSLAQRNHRFNISFLRRSDCLTFCDHQKKSPLHLIPLAYTNHHCTFPSPSLHKSLTPYHQHPKSPLSSTSSDSNNIHARTIIPSSLRLLISTSLLRVFERYRKITEKIDRCFKDAKR